MGDPIRFCGGVKELVQFLDVLRSSCNSRSHLLQRGGPDDIEYAISLLETWSNHRNPTLRQTAMTDPSGMGGRLICRIRPMPTGLRPLFTCDLDTDRRLLEVITLMQGYIQLPQESVRSYANCLKATWRHAGWNLQKHEAVLYDIAWAGLCNSLKNQVGLMTPACGRFDTFDKFFDKAAASELPMSKTRNHSGRNSGSITSSRNSLHTHLPKAACEATSHPSPGQLTPPAANPANRDQTATANQAAEDNRQVYRQHNGFQLKCLKADALPAYAYNTDLRTTRRASALNTHQEVTHHSRTRHLLQTGTEDTKTKDRSPSIINSQKTH